MNTQTNRALREERQQQGMERSAALAEAARQRVYDLFAELNCRDGGDFA